MLDWYTYWWDPSKAGHWNPTPKCDHLLSISVAAWELYSAHDPRILRHKWHADSCLGILVRFQHVGAVHTGLSSSMQNEQTISTLQCLAVASWQKSGAPPFAALLPGSKWMWVWCSRMFDVPMGSLRTTCARWQLQSHIVQSNFWWCKALSSSCKSAQSDLLTFNIGWNLNHISIWLMQLNIGLAVAVDTQTAVSQHQH